MIQYIKFHQILQFYSIKYKLSLTSSQIAGNEYHDLILEYNY